MFTRSLHILFSGFLLLFTAGCVDSVPFMQDEDLEKKLFIECELQPGSPITAYVSYPYFLNGNLANLPPIDTSEIRLSLSEANKDYVIQFKYDKKLQMYYVDSNEFKIRNGIRYILQGHIRNSVNEISVATEIPVRFPYDSIQVVQTMYQVLPNSKIRTTSLIRVHFNRLKTPENYFLHFAFFDNTFNTEIICNPVTDKSAYFKLTHRPGMLMELNRLEKNDYAEITIEYDGYEALKELNFVIKNTTKVYYDYQKFKSNTPTYPTPSSNPAIAAFNIHGQQGYGTFSSISEEVILLPLK